MGAAPLSKLFMAGSTELSYVARRPQETRHGQQRRSQAEAVRQVDIKREARSSRTAAGRTARPQQSALAPAQRRGRSANRQAEKRDLMFSPGIWWSGSSLNRSGSI